MNIISTFNDIKLSAYDYIIGMTISDLPRRACRRIGWIGIEEYFFECLQNCDGIGEDPIRQQKRVQEIDVEESEIGQTFEQPLRCCVSDLRNLKCRFVVVVVVVVVIVVDFVDFVDVVVVVVIVVDDVVVVNNVVVVVIVVDDVVVVNNVFVDFNNNIT